MMETNGNDEGKKEVGNEIDPKILEGNLAFTDPAAKEKFLDSLPAIQHRISQVPASGITPFFTAFDCIRQFHAALRTLGDIRPRPDVKTLQRRFNLIDEEVNKEMFPLLQALISGEKDYTLEHRAQLLDHIIDACYVLMGTAAELGLPFDHGFAIVHMANMRKFSKGIVRREDGKLLKPEGWKSPDQDLHELIRQCWEQATIIDEHQKPKTQRRPSANE